VPPNGRYRIESLEKMLRKCYKDSELYPATSNVRATLRWLDDEENDLQEPKVKKWRQKANNRGEWASVIRRPRFLEDHRIEDYI
jgi:hypothetical protein